MTLNLQNPETFVSLFVQMSMHYQIFMMLTHQILCQLQSGMFVKVYEKSAFPDPL